MGKIKHNKCRKLDMLSDSKKDLICDNCRLNEKCLYAYKRAFFKSICYDIYLEIMDDLIEDEEEEDI